MFSWKESFLHQTLQDRPDRRAVDQLQHKQVGLQERGERGGGGGEVSFLKWNHNKIVFFDKIRSLLTQQQAVTVI